jgi:hypothetical protein
VIIGVFVYTAMKAYRNTGNREVKFLSLSIFLGLITYFVHGTLNNFLDSDKASVPVWAFMAMLTAFDLYFSSDRKA